MVIELCIEVWRWELQLIFMSFTLATILAKKKRLISVAVFLTIQGRVPEGIFVDERRHYGVLLFSMIIYACWLLSFWVMLLGHRWTLHC